VFVIFGVRTRDNVVSRRAATCEVCRADAVQTLVKRTTKLSLFFVPLIPVKPATYYLECAHCGSARRVDARTAGQFA